MKYLKYYDNYHNKIRNNYINLSKNYKCSLEEINNGNCDEISYDVIKNVVGENNYIDISDENLNDIRDNIIYEISDGFFWGNDTESPYKYNGDYWNINHLNMMGKLPFDINKLNNFMLKGHVWIYYNGKHYDSEAPNGVNNFWDLPIYQRQLKQENII